MVSSSQRPDDRYFRSINPSDGTLVWEGLSANKEQIDQAIQQAKMAFKIWRNHSFQDRLNIIEVFTEMVKKEKENLADCISKEVGKPKWEALTEVQGVIGKTSISVEAYHQRCREFSFGNGITRFKPHGVIAVFGSFNFPMHIPNGHIIPALLAGNVVIFKPSEMTPLCGERYSDLLKKSGLPEGVFQCIHGNYKIGEYVVKHNDIDGIYFTGSLKAGLAINRAVVETPKKILALEMGGNNPLVIDKIKNIDAAVYLTIMSAYLTSGQRCSCARRLIIIKNETSTIFLEKLVAAIKKIKVGSPNDDVFMGPVISEKMALKLIEEQKIRQQKGAKVIVELKHLKPGTGFVSPGLIDVTDMKDSIDEEVFGPLLQVIFVKDLDAAIKEANNTNFGLCAGLISDSNVHYEQFRNEVKAGVINWNQQTTGASSGAPFGGVGNSGNFRPSAFFAADYCSYPVASIENNNPILPEKFSPGITL